MNLLGALTPISHRIATGDPLLKTAEGFPGTACVSHCTVCASHNPWDELDSYSHCTRLNLP